MAARTGVVAKVEASFANATRKPGEENYLFVDHGDTTFGHHYHLDQGGAEAGAVVRRRRVACAEGRVLARRHPIRVAALLCRL